MVVQGVTQASLQWREELSVPTKPRAAGLAHQPACLINPDVPAGLRAICPYMSRPRPRLGCVFELGVCATCFPYTCTLSTSSVSRCISYPLSPPAVNPQIKEAEKRKKQEEEEAAKKAFNYVKPVAGKGHGLAQDGAR